MHTILIILAFAFGGTIGLILTRYLCILLRKIHRASDKHLMKAAIAEEIYYNGLYDECIYEEVDKLAVKAAKDMKRKQR